MVGSGSGIERRQLLFKPASGTAAGHANGVLVGLNFGAQRALCTPGCCGNRGGGKMPKFARASASAANMAKDGGKGFIARKGPVESQGLAG